MNFLNYNKADKGQEKDYSFLFQKPEEFEVKVDEEGNYLTDLDAMEIPETAYDSGEDMNSSFMGYDVTDQPYVIGNVTNDNNELEVFGMASDQTNQDYNTIHDYNYDVYIPDAEHTLDYEPQYRDYLNDTRPSIEEEGDDVFNYKPYGSDEEESNEFLTDEFEEEDQFEDYSDKFEDEEEEDYEEDEEEDEEEENEEDEEEEENKKGKKGMSFPKNKMVSIDMSKNNSKEIEEASEYLSVYSSIKESMNLAQKIKVLKEAGYSDSVISLVVSPKKNKIIEKNKNTKLNKFIENSNQKGMLKEIGKHYGLSLKEQKLFEDFAKLQQRITTNIPQTLIVMKAKNTTLEALEGEDKQQYEARLNTIANILGILPTLFAIASASFIKRVENQPKPQQGSTEDGQQPEQAGSNPPQEQPTQPTQPTQSIKQSYKRRNISLRLEEADKVEKEIAELDQYWIQLETKIQKLTTDINTINSKTQGKVSSLKAVGGLLKKGLNKLFTSVVSGIKGAKQFVKDKAGEVKNAYDSEIQGQQAQGQATAKANQSKI